MQLIHAQEALTLGNINPKSDKSEFDLQLKEKGFFVLCSES